MHTRTHTVSIHAHIYTHKVHTFEGCFQSACSTDHRPAMMPLFVLISSIMNSTTCFRSSLLPWSFVLYCVPSLFFALLLLVHHSLDLSFLSSLNLTSFSLSLSSVLPPFLASAAASLLRRMSRELSAAFKGLCVRPFFPLIWFPQNTFP